MDHRLVHQLRYQFAVPARNCRLRLMLEPRAMPYQKVLFEQLHVRSPRSTRTQLLDSHGNRVSEIHVPGPVQQLHVQVLHTLRRAPRAQASPIVEVLAPTLGVIGDASLLPFRTYAAPSFEQGAGPAQSASRLCRRIQQDFRYESRTLTAPHSSALATLKQRAGNCEELAQVAIACLHAMGVQAHFASGYLLSQSNAAAQTDRLHAWVLADCAEDGWLEFDPSTGKGASDNHVLIAWGANALAVRPVTGKFDGGGEHRLTTTLFVERLDTQQ